ncbi:hypothetical protein BH23ACT11_BH23ACT11_28760 [soil metagenome]
MSWEIALLQAEAPALVRFFVGLLVVIFVAGSAALVTYWLNRGG